MGGLLSVPGDRPRTLFAALLTRAKGGALGRGKGRWARRLEADNIARRFRRGSARGDGRGGMWNSNVCVSSEWARLRLSSLASSPLLSAAALADTIVVTGWRVESSSNAMRSHPEQAGQQLGDHAWLHTPDTSTPMSRRERYPAQASEHGVHRHPASPSAIRELPP